MIKREDVFKIGVIGKTHGVRGELNFQFDDDVFDRVDADYLVLMVDGILVPFFIDEYRFRSDEKALILFSDIDTTDKAQQLVGAEVFFPYALSDVAQEEMMHWADFIGFTINDLGEITAVDDATENVLFEVAAADHNYLIPAAEELITDIDYDNRKITMEIPSGLLDL